MKKTTITKRGKWNGRTENQRIARLIRWAELPATRELRYVDREIANKQGSPAVLAFIMGFEN